MYHFPEYDGTYGWIKQPSTDSVKVPSCNSERKAKGEAYEEQPLKTWFGGGSNIVCNLSATKGEEKKHNGPDELARHCNEVVFPYFIRRLPVLLNLEGVRVPWSYRTAERIGHHDGLRDDEEGQRRM